MSLFGTIRLFCPICSNKIIYSEKSTKVYHHKVFGILCDKKCFDAAEIKYVKRILGKSDDD